MFLSRV